MKRLFFITIAMVVFCSCDKTNETTEKEIPFTKRELLLVGENNKFAFDFFRKVAAVETGANYMVSPVSLSLALGMVYNGANGATKTAFDSVLNYSTTLLEVNQFSKKLIANLSNNASGSVMEIANSIWIRQGFQVKDRFIDLNKNYYDAQVESLDFDDPASKNTINGWVSQKTHGKIRKIIENITQKDIMFQINALYFNAIWKHKFDADHTRVKPFYKTPSKTVDSKMMNMKGEVLYSQNALFESIILPYKEDKFNMVILLPATGKTTADIVNQLNTQNWKKWLNDYHKTEVNISIPKFKLSYKNKLNDELEKMGLGIAFSNNANFSNISDSPLAISLVLQKTFIDTNEEGTEAAAVTVVGEFVTSVGPPVFNANRPFLYVIREGKTGAICFIGKVGEPKYEE